MWSKSCVLFLFTGEVDSGRFPRERSLEDGARNLSGSLLQPLRRGADGLHRQVHLGRAERERPQVPRTLHVLLGRYRKFLNSFFNST